MKAQTASEGIIAVAIVLLIFTLLSMTLVSKQIQVENTKDFLAAREVCNNLEREINNVFLLGDGSESTIWLNKNVTVVNGIGKVDNFLCNLCCNLTNGTSYSFNISREFVSITNTDGNIRIKMI